MKDKWLALNADLTIANKDLEKRIRAPQRTEEALRESEERYRDLFRNSHTGVLLIDPENANIVDANPAAVSFYGWSPAELATKKITDINILNENDVFRKMQKADMDQLNHFTFKHRLANGDIRDVDVFSGPIRLQGKRLLYSIIHDVTDRIQAEKEREKLIQDLQGALTEIKTLRGIIPICSNCKNIRNDGGAWDQLEKYISNNSDHYCPV